MWSVWQTCRTGRRAAGFLGGLLVALLLAAGPAAGETFPSSNLMTLSNGGEATHPVMAAGVSSSGEVQVYVAWIEGNEVWLKVGSSPLASQNSCAAGPGPLVFGDPKRLFAVNPSRLAMATHGQAVYVAWLSTRFNGGASPIQLWSSLTESLQDLSFNGNPNNPAVAADSSGVLVAAEGAGDVWLARPCSTCPTGYEYLNLTTNEAGSARRPSIASDGTKVHVVWRNGGVSYRGFDRSVTKAQLDATTIPIPFPTLSLTSASVQFPPKVVVHGSEVTAAWFEGENPLAPTPVLAPTDLKARTTTGGIFDLAVSADTIRSAPSSTPMRLANLSLSVGPGGRLFGWQMADTIALTSSNHYLLKAATDRPFESGSYYELVPGLPTAGPSVVQDTAGRVVASWKENVATTPAIRLGYEGSSGSGGTAPEVTVWHSPDTLQAKSMQGSGVFNFWIEGLNGDFDTDSLKVNGQRVPVIRRSVGDADGDTVPDVHITVLRKDLAAAFAQSNGQYEITGNTKNPSGCFKGGNRVRLN